MDDLDDLDDFLELCDPPSPDGYGGTSWPWIVALLFWWML